jgi:malate synthase
MLVRKSLQPLFLPPIVEVSLDRFYALGMLRHYIIYRNVEMNTPKRWAALYLKNTRQVSGGFPGAWQSSPSLAHFQEFHEINVDSEKE